MRGGKESRSVGSAKLVGGPEANQKTLSNGRDLRRVPGYQQYHLLTGSGDRSQPLIRRTMGFSFLSETIVLLW